MDKLLINGKPILESCYKFNSIKRKSVDTSPISKELDTVIFQYFYKLVARDIKISNCIPLDTRFYFLKKMVNKVIYSTLRYQERFNDSIVNLSYINNHNITFNRNTILELEKRIQILEAEIEKLQKASKTQDAKELF